MELFVRDVVRYGRLILEKLRAGLFKSPHISGTWLADIDRTDKIPRISRNSRRTYPLGCVL